MDKLGRLDPQKGIRSFVVGTGGGGLYGGFTATHPSTGEYQQASHWGVLEMTLHPTSYAWRFVKSDGGVLVSGVGQCH